MIGPSRDANTNDVADPTEPDPNPIEVSPDHESHVQPDPHTPAVTFADTWILATSNDPPCWYGYDTVGATPCALIADHDPPHRDSHGNELRSGVAPGGAA